ncbi:DUF2948 family protein [Parvularcula marina]|uniref:DUF2948 family protein n=2 Tax=Parvularcula marina TaxID=2292771 RepID=A0A371RHC7_9PROT|nr:DUF2948 family protein [Parvularcula marina]
MSPAMSTKNYIPLAMLAADGEDLEIVSSVLQDAVAKIGDLGWFPNQRRFAFVANRFVWEDGVKRNHGPFLRVRTGVHFDDVTRVRTKSVRLDAKEAVIDILSVTYEGDENGGTITLNLAGGGGIALDVEAINGTLKDISDPWRTAKKPDHGAE